MSGHYYWQYRNRDSWATIPECILCIIWGLSITVTCSIQDGETFSSNEISMHISDALQWWINWRTIQYSNVLKLPMCNVLVYSANVIPKFKIHEIFRISRFKYIKDHIDNSPDYRGFSRFHCSCHFHKTIFTFCNIGPQGTRTPRR